MSSRAERANILGDDAPETWAGDLKQLVFRGGRIVSEVYFLHRKSRTLVIGDFIQNYPPGPNRLRNALLKLGGVLGGGVGLDIQLTFIGNKAAGRRSLERLLSWDFDKLILAHGECVSSGAKPFVRRAFRWLA